MHIPSPTVSWVPHLDGDSRPVSWDSTQSVLAGSEHRTVLSQASPSTFALIPNETTQQGAPRPSQHMHDKEHGLCAQEGTSVHRTQHPVFPKHANLPSVFRF